MVTEFSKIVLGWQPCQVVQIQCISETGCLHHQSVHGVGFWNAWLL